MNSSNYCFKFNKGNLNSSFIFLILGIVGGMPILINGISCHEIGIIWGFLFFSLMIFFSICSILIQLSYVFQDKQNQKKLIKDKGYENKTRSEQINFLERVCPYYHIEDYFYFTPPTRKK